MSIFQRLKNRKRNQGLHNFESLGMSKRSARRANRFSLSGKKFPKVWHTPKFFKMWYVKRGVRR